MIRTHRATGSSGRRRTKSPGLQGAAGLARLQRSRLTCGPTGRCCSAWRTWSRIPASRSSAVRGPPGRAARRQAPNHMELRKNLVKTNAGPFLYYKVTTASSPTGCPVALSPVVATGGERWSAFVATTAMADWRSAPRCSATPRPALFLPERTQRLSLHARQNLIRSSRLGHYPHVKAALCPRRNLP